MFHSLGSNILHLSGYHFCYLYLMSQNIFYWYISLLWFTWDTFHPYWSERQFYGSFLEVLPQMVRYYKPLLKWWFKQHVCMTIYCLFQNTKRLQQHLYSLNIDFSLDIDYSTLLFEEIQIQNKLKNCGLEMGPIHQFAPGNAVWSLKYKILTHPMGYMFICCYFTTSIGKYIYFNSVDFNQLNNQKSVLGSNSIHSERTRQDNKCQ